MAQPEVDLSKKYDAVIIGSGAAGGMAAHVLTTHGLQVLLLEAGKKLDIEKELRSMQWPYDNAHRGALPPDSHSLASMSTPFAGHLTARALKNRKIFTVISATATT